MPGCPSLPRTSPLSGPPQALCTHPVGAEAAISEGDYVLRWLLPVASPFSLPRKLRLTDHVSFPWGPFPPRVHSAYRCIFGNQWKIMKCSRNDMELEKFPIIFFFRSNGC